MAATPQIPKCHHNLGYASVVVTFESLWCRSHDLKLGINSYNISYTGDLLMLYYDMTLVSIKDAKKIYIRDIHVGGKSVTVRY